MRIEERVRNRVEPFLEENGCRLWDVIFEKEGAMHYLKILFDDADGSLDLEKCEKLTPPLNKLLDEEEFIKKGQVDIVEIGSPGLSRRLRHAEHFEFCNGKTVKVMKRTDSGKTEVITGILNGFDSENKSVTVDGEEISLKKCIRINLEEHPK
ncbi:MAG: ribosome assembly cofactor RimP [Oscillospiraceae bacterium]|nr:ribosome assembly cofactor RimP [Oscillospiraceae bacterium]